MSWAIWAGVYTTLAQLFANAPDVQPAYEWLHPACQEYVLVNIPQIIQLEQGDYRDPIYRNAVAYVAGRTMYVGESFPRLPLSFQAFVLVHEAAHAEDWRLYERYIKSESEANDKAWGCHFLTLGWGEPVGRSP